MASTACGRWTGPRPAFAGDVVQLVVTLGAALWLVFPLGAMGIAVAMVAGRTAGAAVRWLTLWRLMGATNIGEPQFGVKHLRVDTMNDATPPICRRPSPADPLVAVAGDRAVGRRLLLRRPRLPVSQYEAFAPWSDAEGTLEAGQNVAKGLALALIGLLGAYLHFRRGRTAAPLTGWLPALMIFYLAWSAASVLWSIDPGMSCRRLAVLMFFVWRRWALPGNSGPATWP